MPQGKRTYLFINQPLFIYYKWVVKILNPTKNEMTLPTLKIIGHIC